MFQTVGYASGKESDKAFPLGTQLEGKRCRV